MTKFVDTYALIAWLNRDDNAHGEVRDYFKDLPCRLVTTEWILMEVADALASGQHRAIAAEFLEQIRADACYEVVGYEPSVYKDGFELFKSRADKSWSLTDCISFAVMTRRGLTEALTADRHFIQAGFQAVFAPQGGRAG
jgi:predicted nucleic acid-binding protein